MRTQDRKRTLGKNKGNPNKVQALVNNSISILVHQLCKMYIIHGSNNKRSWVRVIQELTILSSQILYKSKTILKLKVYFLKYTMGDMKEKKGLSKSNSVLLLLDISVNKKNRILIFAKQNAFPLSLIKKGNNTIITNISVTRCSRC